MRRACGLSLTAAGVFAAVVAAQPAAPPAKLTLPPPTLAGPAKLKSDTDELKKEVDEAKKEIPGAAQTSTEREVQLRLLRDILKRVADRPPVAPPPKVGLNPLPGGKDKTGFEFGPPGKVVDHVKYAENLYRGGDTEAALRVFREVDRSLLPREDRAFVQYMLASCLRKTGRRTEAAQVYREVAEAREDDFLSECAIWQLSLIHNSQELEAQLEQLRPRPKSR